MIKGLALKDYIHNYANILHDLKIKTALHIKLVKTFKKNH